MQFTSRLLSLLSMSSNEDVAVQHTADEAMMNVNMDVTCAGVDVEALGLSGLAFVGKALEKSYNQVQQELDDGDSFLVSTHFEDIEHHKKSATGDTLGDGYSSYRYVGGWGCNWCGGMDDDDTWREFDLGDSGNALRAWEMAFTAALIESPHKELKKAKSCDIIITPRAETPLVVELATTI